MGDLKTHKCNICGVILEGLVIYLKHRFHHSREEIGLCVSRLCKKYLKYRQHQWKHKRLKKLELQKKFFSCIICNRKFIKQRIYETHLAIHKANPSKNNDGLKCELCKKGLLSLGALKIHHFKSHGKDELFTFTCKECGKGFRMRWMLRKHKKCHHKKVECNVCGGKFADEYKKKRHMLTHMGVKPNQCSDCGKSFLFKNSLLLHMRVHTGEKPYACELCDKSYTMKTSLNKHMRCHQKDYVNACPVCGKRVTTPASLRLHMRKHTGEKPYSCPTCGKKFASKGYVEVHMRTHSGRRPYACKKCPKTFKQANHLKAHVLTHAEGRLHRCSDCNKDFTLKSTLVQHQQKYHCGGKISPDFHKCPKCDVEFALKEDLRIHLQRTHSMSESDGESDNVGSHDRLKDVNSATPFLCHVCGKSFGLKGQLKKHFRIHQRLFRCKLCEKSFELENSLINHMNIHSKRLHACHLCCSSFSASSTLKTHMLTHTGERPYACVVCDKKFSLKSNLTVHMRTHTKERPFKCRVCSRTFTQKGSLNYHMKRHTQEITTKASEMPYSCDDCEEEFASQEDLTTHFLMHKAAEPKQQCSICDGVFLSEDDLHSHMTTHAEEEHEASVVKMEDSSSVQEIIVNAGLKQVIYIKDNTYMDSELEGMTQDSDANVMLDCEDPLSTEDLEQITTHSDGGIDLDTGLEDISVAHDDDDDYDSNGEGIFLVDDCIKEEPLDSHLCEISFYQNDPLRTCVVMHRINKSHKCALCGEVFINKRDLDDHILTHTNIHQYDARDFISVEECESYKGLSSQPVYSEIDQLTILNEELPESGEGPLLGNNSLSSVIKVEDNEKPHRCNTCGKGFSVKSNLKNHLLLHSGQKAFQCELCNKRFALQSYLKEHMVTHTKEKPYNCKMCEKRFSQKSSLNYHLKVHADIKPFCCTWCGKTFLTESGLNKHVLIHTLNVFDCTVCGKSFSKSKLLETHLKVHEICTTTSFDEQAVIVVNADPFKCTICGENFRGNHELEEHLVKHSMERSSQSDMIIKAEQKLEKEEISGDETTHGRPTSTAKVPKKRHDCPDCDKSFVKPAHLKIHRRVHTGEKPYTCDICSRTFSTTKNLKTHLLVHTGEKPHQCGICGKRFTQSVHRRNHMRIHSEVKPYICILCGKGYTVSNSLKLHMKSHTGDKPFECSLCSKRFSQRGLLKSHMISHTGNKRFRCIRCGQKFSVANALQKHLLAHQDLKPYQCTLCEQDFSHKSNLVMHLQERHARDSDCTLCGKELMQNEIQSHVFRHHQESYRGWTRPSEDAEAELEADDSYFCCICKKAFSRKIDLKTHLLIHGGIRPYECSSCGRRFSEVTLLEAHELTHIKEESVSQLLFKCDICSKEFSRKSNYDSHVATHSKNKSYECPECGTVLKTKGTFKSHMLIHSSERPHKCITCGKGFLTRGNFKVHLLTHGNERPYECHVCHSRFKVKSHLQNHLKVHNKKVDKAVLQKQAELESRKRFSCRLCNKKFVKKDKLMTHLLSHEVEKPYNCKYCIKGFSRKATLDKHMLTHEIDLEDPDMPHPEVEKIASNVQVIEDSETDLRSMTHILSHEGGKPYNCKCCSKGFSRKATLDKHMLTHEIDLDDPDTSHPEVEKIASNVQVIEDSETDLRSMAHILSHEGGKPYNCKCCSKGFSRKATLDKHMLTHEIDLDDPDTSHPEVEKIASNVQVIEDSETDLRSMAHILSHEGGKPYNCKCCSKGFSRKATLDKHMLTHEIDLDDPDTSHPEVEKIASNVQVIEDSETDLRSMTHILSHEGGKPYNCKCCSKGFSRKATLDKHMLTHEIDLEDSKTDLGSMTHILSHEGGKPYNCKCCSKGFSRKATLDKHMLTHEIDLEDSDTHHQEAEKIASNVQQVIEDYESEFKRSRKKRKIFLHNVNLLQ